MAFATQEELNVHVSTAHPQTLSCPTCGMTFPTTEALNSHIQSAHPAALNCPKCGMSFSTAAELNAHIAATHKEGAMSDYERAQLNLLAQQQEQAKKQWFADIMQKYLDRMAELAKTPRSWIDYWKLEHGTPPTLNKPYATPSAENPAMPEWKVLLLSDDLEPLVDPVALGGLEAEGAHRQRVWHQTRQMPARNLGADLFMRASLA